MILIVGVIFFGPKKIPELGKGLGEGIRGFKEALRSATEEAPATPETPQNGSAETQLKIPRRSHGVVGRHGAIASSDSFVPQFRSTFQTCSASRKLADSQC